MLCIQKVAMFSKVANQAITWKLATYMIPTRSFQKPNKSRLRSVDMKTLTSALKPFYFLVHPDLFGNLPDRRRVNEESLMALNSFLQMYVENKKQINFEKSSLKFFIRDSQQGSNSVSEIWVKLYDASPVVIVDNILKSAGLPPIMSKHKPILTNTGQYQGKQLINFLEKNGSVAETKLQKTMVLRQRKDELIKKICSDLELTSFDIESNWRIDLQNSYLRNVDEFLQRNKADVMKCSGLKIVLCSWSGIDVSGKIYLHIEDEPFNWMKLLKNGETFKTLLHDTEQLISNISKIMRGLVVERQIFDKKYYNLSHFYQDLTSLYRKLVLVDKPVVDLSGQKVIFNTCSTEKPSILPNGSFLLPLFLPGNEMVSFLNTFASQATDTRNEYKRQLTKEKETIHNCITQLKLQCLSRSTNIEPNQMIACCQELMKLNCVSLTQNLGITVDQRRCYYASADGLLTIPWNWYE